MRRGPYFARQKVASVSSRSFRLLVVELGVDLGDELLPVLVEVAVELGHRALVHDPDLAGLRVQHLAADVRVVRDEHHAALELVQRRAQRVDGFHVKVVRRLVHQQDVRVRELDAREHHARFLSAAELHDGRQVVVPGQAELPELRADLLWLVRAPLGLEVLPKQVLHGIFVHGQNVHEVLRVPSDAKLVRPPRVALGGRQVAREQVHERGLARAVGTDDAHSGAHVDAEVEVVQPEALQVGVLEVAVRERDERRRQLRGRREVKLHRVIVPPRRRGVAASVVVVVVLHHALVLPGSFLLGSLRRRVLHRRLRVLRLPLLRRLRGFHLLLVLLVRLVRLPAALLVHLLEVLKRPAVLRQLVVVQVDDVRRHGA
mmetsp:Transcript_15883/g.66970  ORF Transcript_15883/g.66970 Transcript_15883/m.66970 type:complete len:373 (+) Transcript_15883:717-1835(+)